MLYDPWTASGFAGAVDAYERWFLTEPEPEPETQEEDDE